MSWRKEASGWGTGMDRAGGRRGRSLAWRLTVWYAGFSFCAVACATVVLYVALARNLTQDNDRLLADRVHVLRALLRDRPDNEEQISFEVDWPSQKQVPVHVRVFGTDGKNLFESSGIGDELPAVSFPSPVATDDKALRGKSIVGLSGRRHHAVAVRAARGKVREALTIQVARDLSHEELLLAAYRTNLWVVLGAAFVVCVAGGYAIARRGLRPVARIRDVMRHVSPTTLDQRLATQGLPAELHELARTLNNMLGVLQESFDRLSRLAADVAHELRTPIGALRGAIEVCLNRDRTAADYRDSLESCLDDCLRLSRTIDSVMFLAKADKRMTPITLEWVDLLHELEAIRELYEASAAEHGVTLTGTWRGSVMVKLDRTLFQRAVCNLVENALKNTAKHGTVILRALSENGTIFVEVADTGRGIPVEDLPYVFEPFYRADRARSAGSGGAGLGLAIVKSIADLHGGNVHLQSTLGRGTTVRVTFPANRAVAENTSILTKS